MEERLLEIQAQLTEPEEPPDPDLLADLSRRLDEGLSEVQRQKVVRLLVKQITVHTEVKESKRSARVVIQYRFPDVVTNRTCRDSGRRLALSWIDYWPVMLLTVTNLSAWDPSERPQDVRLNPRISSRSNLVQASGDGRHAVILDNSYSLFADKAVTVVLKYPRRLE